MPEYNYEITLQPLEHYFFGGERTHNTAQSEESNYFAVSNRYPQQSTLLGLWRYLMLAWHDLLPLTQENQADAKQRMGPRSFNSAKPQELQTFGEIKAIAPLLLKHQDRYHRLGYDIPQGAFSWLPTKALTAGGIRDQTPRLAGFNPKQGLAIKALPEQGESVKLDSIFSPHTQIGIQKQADEEGFFKQQAYRLAKGWSFSCFAKIASDLDPDDTLVPFGADQRPFRVQVRKVKPTELPSWLSLSSTGDTSEENACLVLLSDAVWSHQKSVYDYCDFALSETVDFRSVRMGHRHQDFAKDSVKYNLLQRGTLLFPRADDQLQSLCEALEKPQNFRQIGFNQYFLQTY